MTLMLTSNIIIVKLNCKTFLEVYIDIFRSQIQTIHTKLDNFFFDMCFSYNVYRDYNYEHSGKYIYLYIVFSRIHKSVYYNITDVSRNISTTYEMILIKMVESICRGLYCIVMARSMMANGCIKSMTQNQTKTIYSNADRKVIERTKM